MEKTKQKYVSPRIEVIELENEGVIASSVVDFPVNPMSSNSQRHYKTNSASSSDLEDMINDILTVGE